MIDKDVLLSQLVTFSCFDRPLDARYFYDRYHSKDESILDYKRNVAKLIREIQNDQFYLQKIDKPFYLVFSCNEGYFIARNRGEALIGKEFYFKRARQIIEYTKKLENLINNVFPEPEQTSLNL
ncbi:MAG: hypothetical protein ABFS12_13970 [Bacteroidota bacterium]